MFSINEKNCTISPLSGNAEIHGDEYVSAASFVIKFRDSNNLLDDIDPQLKHAFFTKASEEEMDMADKGMDENHLTKLRSPLLPKNFKLDWVGQGYRVIVHRGLNEDANIYLIMSKLSKLKVEPIEGGMVDYELTVYCHPDEKDGGALLHLAKQKADVTLEPPSAEKLAQMELDEQKKAIAEEEGDDYEDEQQSDPVADSGWPDPAA